MPKPKKQHLKQRSDGRFVCVYCGVFFYGKTEGECLAKREAYIKQESERNILPMYKIVERYAAEWVNIYKSHLTTASYNAVVRTLNRFCAEHGTRLMTSITPMDIQAFYNQYEDMSQSSINSMRDTIRGMFRAAVADRVIQYDPTAKAKLPKGTKGSHRAITQHERDLIHSVQHRLRPCVMLMLYAGLRRGEALALDIDRDIDFEKRTITVREAVRFEHQTQPTIASTKTEAGLRVVPLFQPLYDELYGRHGLVVEKQKKPSKRGKNASNHASQSSWKSAWKSYITALEKAENGISKRWYGKTKAQKFLAEMDELPDWKTITIRSHDLRHSFATMIRDAGTDLKLAMQWMGHADEEMLLRIYDHPDEYRSNLATKNIEKMLLNSHINSQNTSTDAESR